MKKLNYGITCLVITIFLFSCSPSTKLYRTNRYEKHQLSEAAFVSLKDYLTTLDAVPKDTIIIKYDFNHEDCWNMLDQQTDEYIASVIGNGNKRINSAIGMRKNISVYQVREAGKDFNKLKLRNPEIKIDNLNLLKSMIFSNRASCGSSAIVLSTGVFLLIKSDSHFEALDLSSTQLQSLLNK